MMRPYEFRFAQAKGMPAIVTMEMHLTDNAAVRAARKAAMGKPFEVWRGSVLVSQLKVVPTASAN